jgi:hypothetical protein
MTDPTITLIRGDTVLPLHRLIARGLMRLDEDGLGLPPVQRLTERGPAQHGDTDVGFRLQPRTINLVLLLDGAGDVGAYWEERRTLQRMLRPSSVPLNLRYVLPNGDERQIDVVFSGGLSWGSTERQGETHRAAFQLRAADPTWYDPTEVGTVFALVSSGEWEIPWSIPWSIADVERITALITTPGDWESNPRIIVTGPVEDLVIANKTTDEKLDFTGTVIADGDGLIIDTRYGIKTVVDFSGVNQLNLLSDDSDLATFRIAADPDAPGGVNEIEVAGSGLSPSTQVLVSFFTRYVAL